MGGRRCSQVWRRGGCADLFGTRMPSAWQCGCTARAACLAVPARSDGVGAHPVPPSALCRSSSPPSAPCPLRCASCWCCCWWTSRRASCLCGGGGPRRCPSSTTPAAHTAAPVSRCADEEESAAAHALSVWPPAAPPRPTHVWRGSLLCGGTAARSDESVTPCGPRAARPTAHHLPRPSPSQLTCGCHRVAALARAMFFYIRWTSRRSPPAPGGRPRGSIPTGAVTVILGGARPGQRSLSRTRGRCGS